MGVSQQWAKTSKHLRELVSQDSSDPRECSLEYNRLRRARALLDPADREAFDALVVNWEGSGDDLLACVSALS